MVHYSSSAFTHMVPFWTRPEIMRIDGEERIEFVHSYFVFGIVGVSTRTVDSEAVAAIPLEARGGWLRSELLRLGFHPVVVGCPRSPMVRGFYGFPLVSFLGLIVWLNIGTGFSLVDNIFNPSYFLRGGQRQVFLWPPVKANPTDRPQIEEILALPKVVFVSPRESGLFWNIATPPPPPPPASILETFWLFAPRTSHHFEHVVRLR